MPSEILKDQENKIHLGKLANEDMNLDSKIEKENKIIGGQKGTILTYYFVEDWSINNPNEVSYCEDVFIP